MYTWNVKYFRQRAAWRLLSTVVSAGSGLGIPSYASDIEVYQSRTKGEVTIVMMLDTSGSMDIYAGVSIEACDLPNSKKSTNYSFSSEFKAEKGYRVSYCIDEQGKKYYDRLSRLKDALFILATSTEIPANTKIGIGTFPYISGTEVHKRGYIRIAVDYWGEVGSEQRQKVLNMIRNPQFRGKGSTPTPFAYAEAAAYMLGSTTDYNSGYSGMRLVPKEEAIKIMRGRWESEKRYISPLPQSEDSQCDGQGIYFLTDGEPQIPEGSEFRSAMASALGFYEYTIDGKSGLKGGRYNIPTDDVSYWGAIGQFARFLNDPATTSRVMQKKTPTWTRTHTSRGKATASVDGIRLRTAIVGYGSYFNVEEKHKHRLTDPKTQKSRIYYDCKQIIDEDARNACHWGEKSKFSDGTPTIEGVGGYGEGGFYAATSTDELINSIINFIEESRPEFEPLIMGAPTIPVDNLLPIQIQPYAYYSTFVPKPTAGIQLWLGNLNKFHIYNGEIYSANKATRLIKQTGEIDQKAIGLWGEGGFKVRLRLGANWSNSGDYLNTQRRLYSNRKVNIAGEVEAATDLNSVDLNSLFNSTPTHLDKDPDKNYWLNLLGFQVPISASIEQLTDLPKQELRQVGAMLHSKPILLTQQGRIEYQKADAKQSKGRFESRQRKDYLLFGSTQGLLHVLDDQGQEVFAFVPNEMMQKQKAAFLSAELSARNEGLYYGVDATWSAHSQYFSRADGLLTVNEQPGKATVLKNDGTLGEHALQWVYGGLRMGGRSYYALDLSHLNARDQNMEGMPKLKFHIDPERTQILSSHVEHRQGWTDVKALKYMGQSWSKPTLAYVNWFDGQQKIKKLVMFVGGGYDATGSVNCGDSEALKKFNNQGYECPTYQQQNSMGAGVYMFDADTGELLWWASREAYAGMGAQAVSNSEHLKYSVVSQINTIDRDNDGLVDALYFGDLGGQVFRVDLDNQAHNKQDFAKRIFRLLNRHQQQSISPRFYEMPSFSVHQDPDGLYAVVSLSSGNASSPLAEGDLSAQDGIYVIYDNDIARPDLFQVVDHQLRNRAHSTTLPVMDSKKGISRLNSLYGKRTYLMGWWSPFSRLKGEYKGIGEVFVIDKLLYANIYFKNGQGMGGGCGAQVIGDSMVFQYCLPTGRCEPPIKAAGIERPHRMKIGAGILGTGLAKGYTNEDGTLSVAINRENILTDCNKQEFRTLSQCQLYETVTQMRTLSWDEHVSKQKK